MTTQPGNTTCRFFFGRGQSAALCRLGSCWRRSDDRTRWTSTLRKGTAFRFVQLFEVDDGVRSPELAWALAFEACPPGGPTIDNQAHEKLFWWVTGRFELPEAS